MKNLIVVGDSQAAGFTEDSGTMKSYGQWLAEYNNLQLFNFSKPGVDNTFIKRSLLSNIGKFKQEETFVIFHTAPFTRRLFWFDENKPIDKSDHIWYPSFTGNDSKGWYRSKGNARGKKGVKTAVNITDHKNVFGNHYFDVYYHTYFSLLESYGDTLDALLSVQDYLNNRNYKYLFVLNNKNLLKESVPHKEEFCYALDNLDYTKFLFQDKGFDDFILINKYTVTETDYHASAKGHEEYSKLVQEHITKHNLI